MWREREKAQGHGAECPETAPPMGAACVPEVACTGCEGTAGCPHGKSGKLDPDLTPHIRISSLAFQAIEDSWRKTKL